MLKNTAFSHIIKLMQITPNDQSIIKQMDLEHHETPLPGKSTLVSFLFFYMPSFPSSFPDFVLFLFNYLLSLSMFWMHGEKKYKTFETDSGELL